VRERFQSLLPACGPADDGEDGDADAFQGGGGMLTYRYDAVCGPYCGACRVVQSTEDDTLDALAREWGRERGVARWLEDQRVRWTCPGCGARLWWYAGTCRMCGATVRDSKAEENEPLEGREEGACEAD
jgi:ribosomal protein L40E